MSFSLSIAHAWLLQEKLPLGKKIGIEGERGTRISKARRFVSVLLTFFGVCLWGSFLCANKGEELSRLCQPQSSLMKKIFQFSHPSIVSS